jgi:hypothetical protein
VAFASFAIQGAIVRLTRSSLWGKPDHLKFLTTSIRERFPDLDVLVPKSNSGSFTYDGIELGGERVANEVEARLEELKKEGHTITKFSITGYSLGGLVARYAIGLLYHHGVFEKIQPVVCIIVIGERLMGTCD